LQLARVRAVWNSSTCVLVHGARTLVKHCLASYVPAQIEGLVMDGVTSHVGATAVTPQVVATGAGVLVAEPDDEPDAVGAGVVTKPDPEDLGADVSATTGAGVFSAVGSGVACTGTGVGLCVGAGVGGVGEGVGCKVGAGVMAEH
jgi:hypothetical protein